MVVIASGPIEWTNCIVRFGTTVWTDFVSNAPSEATGIDDQVVVFGNQTTDLAGRIADILVESFVDWTVYWVVYMILVWLQNALLRDSLV